MYNLQKLFASGIIMIIMTVLVLPVLVVAQNNTGAQGGINNTGAQGGINNTGAQGGINNSGSGPIKITNPFKGDNIRDLIRSIVNDILLPVGSVVAAVMIIYAGFLYVTAAGDPGQIKKAHDALLWAVIGAAILLGAWAISEAIRETVDTLRK